MPKGQPGSPPILSIGPLQVGGSAPTPDTVTIGDLQSEGTTVVQVLSVADGKPHIEPGYVIQPGDRIYAQDPQGHQSWTTVTRDDQGNYGNTGWVATKPESTARTAPQVTLPTEGTPLERQTAIRDAALNRYNDPNTPETEKAGLLSLIHQAETSIRQLNQDEAKATGKDADTQALAQAAIAKGSKASPQEVAAYFKVYGGTAAGQPSQYVMPIAGYSGQIEPHHAGNANGAVDLFAPPGTPVQVAASGTVLRAGPYGAAGNDVLIRGDDGRYYDYEHVDGLQLKSGQRVQAGAPLGVVATLENGGSSVGDATHLHFAVGGGASSIDYGNHGTSTDFDTTGFIKSLQAGQQPAGLPANPFAPPPPKPEVHALGNRLYQHNPDGSWSVVVDATDMQAPTVHQLGNTLYQWDPGTKQWTQAVVGPPSADMIKAQQEKQGQVATLIQQAQATKDYIQQQLASGALTPDQANQYMDNLNAYTQAGLQGTTPYDLWKTQQDDDIRRQQVAKDLLDTKLQQTTSMADNLLGDSMRGLTASKYGTVAPGTFAGIFQGALDTANQQAKPLTDLAQQLLASVGTKAAAAGLDPRIPIPGLSGVNDPNPVAAPAPAPMAA